MSVNLGDDLDREGLEPDFALRNHAEHHLVLLTAGFVRAEEQIVYRDHLPDDATHGEVYGSKNRSRSNRFAKTARWAVLRSERLREDLRSRHEASLA